MINKLEKKYIYLFYNFLYYYLPFILYYILINNIYIV